MPRRSKGCLYRKSTKRLGKTVKAGAWRARYRGGDGQVVDEVLTNSNDESIYDKAVAELLLNQRLRQAERESVGLIDPMVRSASMPVRVVLARFVCHLRGKNCGQKYIRQALAYNKKILARAGMMRLADFNESRIDRALAAVAADGRAPRTVNAYREVAYALGEWALKVARLLDRNPVAVIAKWKESGERRKERRSLTVDEAL